MSQEWIYTLVFLAWLVGAVAFVLGLHQMNSPATARGGNKLSAAGMTVAVVATFVWLFVREGSNLLNNPLPIVIIVGGFLIGGGIGLYPRPSRPDDGHAAARLALQCCGRRRCCTCRD